MSIASLDDMFERLSSALAVHGFAVRDLRRLPNLLSLSRLVLGALFPLTVGRPWWSLAILAVAGLTDVLDGFLARRTHQETPTGAVVDAIADKLFVLSVIVTLVASGRLSLLAVVLLGTRDIGEVLLGLRLLWADKALLGRSANAGGKITTTLQYVALVAVIFGSAHAATLIVVAAVAGLTATIAYWHRDLASERARPAH